MQHPPFQVLGAKHISNPEIQTNFIYYVLDGLGPAKFLEPFDIDRALSTETSSPDRSSEAYSQFLEDDEYAPLRPLTPPSLATDMPPLLHASNPHASVCCRPEGYVTLLTQMRLCVAGPRGTSRFGRS